MSRTAKLSVVFVSVTLACLRVLGCRSEAFQASAHLWVGFLIGMAVSRWRDRRQSAYWWLGFAAAMTVVEVLVFVAQQLEK